MKNKIPQEAWTGMNHSVSHLKVFGCVAYAHVRDELRRKLDKKGQKCIFVGYSEDTKAYKMYDPVTKKVIISRDVQFVENESWDGTVDTNVKIVSNIENDDMEEEVVQTQHVIQLVEAPSTPMTACHGSTQEPSTQVAAQATPTNTPRGQQTPSSRIRGNLGYKMDLIRKRTNNKFCELEFKNQ